MIKGLKCTNCGCEFVWKEATNKKFHGMQNICNCPQCGELIMSNIPTSNYIVLVFFAVGFFGLAFWSIIYSTSDVTITIAIIGVTISYLIPKLFFKSGYLLMSKVNASD